MNHSSPRLWLWAAAESARATTWIALALFLGVAQLQPLRPPVRTAMAIVSLSSIAIGNLTRLRARDRWAYRSGWESLNQPWLQGRQSQSMASSSMASPPMASPPMASPPMASPPMASPPMAWLTEILGYPSVLIWGAPGSGKSTFAQWIITERQALGHEIEILDPHREYGQWSGLAVTGDGLDYPAINDSLIGFLATVTDRYQLRATTPNYQPPPLTILAEEFTQWGKKCAAAAEFFEVSVSDIRKIACHVIYVSHARTLTGLGGATGLAKTRDASLLELELIAKVDPKTGKATPSGRGRLRYPGGHQVEVQIPKIEGFSQGSARVQPGFTNVPANEVPGVPATLNPEPIPEPSEPDLLNLARSLIIQGLPQDEIIFRVWGAKKGGSDAYREAREQVRRLRAEMANG
jgi:hypothetical protein